MAILDRLGAVFGFPYQEPDPEPEVLIVVEPDPPKARLCERCGKWKAWSRPVPTCPSCRFAQFQDFEPKRHETQLPCRYCGTTHSSSWEVGQFEAGGGRTAPQPTCWDCWKWLSYQEPQHFHAADGTPEAPRLKILGGIPTSLGRSEAEALLDARVGEITAVAEVWSNGSTRILHGITRHLLGAGDDTRPLAAHELKSYTATQETLRPLHWIPLRLNVARRYARRYREGGVLPGHDYVDGFRTEMHEDGTTHVVAPELDEMVVQWARDIRHFAAAAHLSHHDAAEILGREGKGRPGMMAVRPGPDLLVLALRLASSGQQF